MPADGRCWYWQELAPFIRHRYGLDLFLESVLSGMCPIPTVHPHEQPTAPSPGKQPEGCWVTGERKAQNYFPHKLQCSQHPSWRIYSSPGFPWVWNTSCIPRAPVVLHLSHQCYVTEIKNTSVVWEKKPKPQTNPTNEQMPYECLKIFYMEDGK